MEENIEEKFEEKPEVKTEVKKSKKGKVLFLLILIIVICAALAGAYFFVFAKPQYVFKKAINKCFKTKNETYETVNLDVAVNVSGELKEEEYNNVLKEIAKCVLKLNSQIDFEEKTEILSMGLTYDSKDVISLKEYLSSDEMYLYLVDIFDKGIKIDVPEEASESLEEVFESGSYSTNKKASKIFGDELNKVLSKHAKYSQEKVTKTIDNQEVELTKSLMTLNYSEVYNVMSITLKNLSENEEFLAYCKSGTKEEFVKLSEKMSDSALSANEQDTITFAIYSEGFLYTFKGLEIIVNDKEGEITILEKSKTEYEFTIYSNEEETVTGTFEKTKDGFIVTVMNDEIGTIKIKVNCTLEYNKKLEKIDTSNCISSDDLTEEDYMSILEKLSDRPLIGDYISSYMSMYQPEEDYSTEELKTANNEVADYGFSVEYEIPEGFKCLEDYGSDTYKLFKKELDDYDYISAKTMLRYRTNEGYLDEIKSSCDYYKESDSYKNVSLADTKEMEVEGNKFYYTILEYESDYGYGSETYKYKNVYIWKALGDSVLYTVEIDAENQEIDLDMFKEFLNIKIQEID